MIVQESVSLLIPDWLLWTYILGVGACVGSFLNVVIARLPEGMSVVTPRSRCPQRRWPAPPFAAANSAMKVSLPMTAGLRAVYPASLTMLEGIPGIAYRDSMITFPADSMRHAYDVMLKLVGVATSNYSRLLQRAVKYLNSK